MNEEMRVSYVFMCKNMQVSIRGDKVYTPDIDIKNMNIEYFDCEPLSNDEFHFEANKALAQFEAMKKTRERGIYAINNFPDFRKSIYVLYKTVSKICDSISIEEPSDFTEMKEAICKLYEPKEI